MHLFSRLPVPIGWCLELQPGWGRCGPGLWANPNEFLTHLDSPRRSSVTIGTIQRILAWPLRKDDTHKSRSVNNFFAQCPCRRQPPAVSSLSCLRHHWWLARFLLTYSKASAGAAFVRGSLIRRRNLPTHKFIGLPSGIIR